MSTSQSTFDRLVAELSDEEREDLFARLTDSLLPVEPKGQEHPDALEGVAEVNLDYEFRRLGLFRRLWVLLRALFQGKERDDVLERDLLRSTAREVNRACPGFLDYDNQRVQQPFHEELRGLAENARQCGRMLRDVMGENRSHFLAFLLELENEVVGTRLREETDPDRVSRQVPDISEAELKRRVESAVDEILNYLPGDLREAMYTNARFLDNLRVLCEYPFPQLLSVFYQDGSGTPGESPFQRVRDPVAELAGITYGLHVTPGKGLVRGVYHYLRGQAQREQTGGEEAVEEYLSSFTRAYDSIQRFVRTVPLVRIARLVNNSIHFQPEVPKGGEDWFARVKQFWAQRVSAAYQTYAFSKKQSHLLEELSEALGRSVSPFDRLRDPFDARPSKLAYPLGIAMSFVSSVYFDEVHPILKTIHLKGQFYKDANRAEFTQSFDSMSELHERLERFRRTFEDEGDYTRPYHRLEKLVQRGLSRDDSEVVTAVEEIRSIESEAESLIKSAIRHTGSLARVTNGILHGEVAGQYDTLSNLKSIEGPNSDRYLTKLGDAAMKLRRTADILSRSYDLSTMKL